MKSIPNNPASTCSPFARNGGIQPSAAAERQNAAQTPPSEAVPVGLRSSGRPKAGRTSITKRVKTALATALLTGLTTVLYAAPPTITARVEPDSIGIGDRFDVVIDVDRDLVQVVEFPTFNPPPQSGLEVVESHPVDTLRRDGRHLSLRKRYTLAAFEEGNLGLGRAQVLYLDKNITTRSIPPTPCGCRWEPFRSTPRRTRSTTSKPSARCPSATAKSAATSSGACWV